jgi:hypothetical protein
VCGGGPLQSRLVASAFYSLAGLIYPAVLAAWTYLAVLYDNPSRTADPSRARDMGLLVFVGGFALILLYDGFLESRIDGRLRITRCRAGASLTTNCKTAKMTLETIHL